jgi:hypothetical protein
MPLTRNGGAKLVIFSFLAKKFLYFYVFEQKNRSLF